MMNRLLPLLLLVAGPGCTVISLSAVGSLAELGNSSVTVGRDAYYFGRLKTAEMAHFQAAIDAAGKAASDLGMRVKDPVTIEEGIAEMAFVDDRGTQVGVQVDRRSPSLVRIRCDVGWFGSEITDRLFLYRMRMHLPQVLTTQPTTSPTVLTPMQTLLQAEH